MKAIISDLDKTMWGGIAKVDDVIVHDGVYEKYKLLLMYLISKGIRVGIVSRNEHNDQRVWDQINKTGLGGDVYPIILSKAPKSESVKYAAQCWGIPEEEILFIDDSLYECEEVQKNTKAKVKRFRHELFEDLIDQIEKFLNISLREYKELYLCRC